MSAREVIRVIGKALSGENGPELRTDAIAEAIEGATDAELREAAVFMAHGARILWASIEIRRSEREGRN